MASSQQIFDDLLVLNAQKGDRNAFDLLFKRWHPKLVRQIEWRVHDVEVAQDLAQECWITIAKKIVNLRGHQSFGAWATRIANNKAVDWLRRNQVRQQKIKTHQEEYLPDDPEEKELLLRQMEVGFRQLENEQKMILRLHYLEQLSLKEIARVLNMPTGTVKSRLFRARENLKKIILNNYDDEN